jgi:transposase
VGRITAAIMVAEIGDVTRFPDARHLCSWAGLTPTHRESDTKAPRPHHQTRLHAGAVGGDRSRSPLPRRRPHRPAFTRIAKRRGVMIARVAAARKLLSLIFYGLRDGEIRRLVREAG